MILFKQISQLQQALAAARNENKSIGFVPTMGALHQGHLSLIAQSKRENDITVCSIFVNPTQFNDPKDFEKYPITTAQDIQLSEQAGLDILFMPTVDEMYPNGQQLATPYPLGRIETLLEGAFRPGHFQGVCQVVHHLLNIVQPDAIVMGQKDYQQCMVISKLLEITGLPTQLKLGATLRETDGLAMSSRNVRLSPEARQKATAIYKSLTEISQHITKKDIITLEEEATSFLLKNGFDKVDYISIADAVTLEPVTKPVKDQQLVVLVAAFIDNVRLIDNLLFSFSS
ncbi:pantothenate synthetase [Filimonas lacunae]|uniref:Pantothenate synthetase n=1 Tax=Filimonas lacunae TaxID=477680 RepID=A0A173MCK4_9BACT|nr:pantoate--beta-alanine ligase [Filimonas lacunae]BAV05219.1 pantoate--beta-alanine ligase [Filimonas lacunae]SIT22569.1 pantothenate synthetase [Filimonas lacunae]